MAQSGATLLLSTRTGGSSADLHRRTLKNSMAEKRELRFTG
ncbi:hypothetical protein [Halodesulfovibrio spirochaetisodalis]|nr:hypothetical protein [Halodesulfovibrio spirochaetisodalis]